MANDDSYTEFTWGKAKASSNKEKKFYTSFFYDNEEFSLYDNVIVYDAKQPDGHVAKIMKLWEDIASGTMMALLRWFLKPLELPPHLHGQVLCENSRELFLAFGKGRGVSNENKLDCIERKCKVLCTSKDSRNKQPSEEDLKAADYFFNRIYNVDLKKLSNLEGIVKILGQDVLFNKSEWILNEQSTNNQKTGSSVPVRASPTVSQQPLEDGEVLLDSDLTTKEPRGNQGQSLPLKHTSEGNSLPVKRTNFDGDGDKTTESPGAVFQASIKKGMVHLSSGASRASQDVLERSPLTAQQPLTRSASAKKIEQGLSKAKIEANITNEKSTGKALFAAPVWQPGFLMPTRARSKQVHNLDTIRSSKLQHVTLMESLSHGRVLLIQNVDPSVTLKDMNDLMKSTLEGCSEVQMLQRSSSLFALAGEALLVFETEDLADAALRQFEESCLIVSGCTSPLIASKIGPPDPGIIARFPGHFPLENFKLWKQRQEEVMRKSSNMFHFSDPKTVEFEMATEWKYLHEFLSSCWDNLCKEQVEETKLAFEKYRKPKLTLP